MPPFYRKISARVLPLLFFCYLVNYLDRTNISFAKLTMSASLGIDAAAYGFGAGLFFIGYFFFQLPSNLMLVRLGSRRWIATILVVWGLVSAATIFVHDEWQFYFARFCLGATEAGFFPGVIYYFTRWYPAAARGRILALFLIAIPVSGIVGGPLSGWVLATFRGGGGDGALLDWQWLFLLESLPCFAAALWVWIGLPDDMDAVAWLTAAEKAELAALLQKEAEERARQDAPAGAAAALRLPAVWQLCLVYFCTMMGLYGYSFWLPQTIVEMGWKDPLHIGLISAIPALVAAIFMVLWGARSDRKQERRLHSAGAALLAAVGFAGVGLAPGGWTGLVALCIADAGVMAMMATLWAFPGTLLGGAAAATGIALINSMGNLGGFVSPTLLGQIIQRTGHQASAQYATSLFLLFSAGVLLFGRSLSPKKQSP